MMDRLVKTTAILCGLALLTGCSMISRYGLSISSEDERPSSSYEGSQRETYIRVWLDEDPATPDGPFCKVSRAISLSPQIRYEITQPDKIGRVRSIIINVFREFDGGWSSNADFIVTAADVNNAEAQMKPNTVYHLGAPGDSLRVMDGSGGALAGMQLESGRKYLMNFAVSADRSETVSIVFEVR